MGLFRAIKELFFGVSRNEKLYFIQESTKEWLEKSYDMLEPMLDDEVLDEQQNSGTRKLLYNKVIKKSFDTISAENGLLLRSLDKADNKNKFFLIRREFFHKLLDEWFDVKDDLEMRQFFRKECVGLSNKQRKLLLGKMKAGVLDYLNVSEYMDVKTIIQIKHEKKAEEGLEQTETVSVEETQAEDVSSPLLATSQSEVKENEADEVEIEEEIVGENEVFGDEEESKETESFVAEEQEETGENNSPLEILSKSFNVSKCKNA